MTEQHDAFRRSVRDQLAAVPARGRTPLPPQEGFWHSVRAALAFRPVHDPADTPPTPAPSPAASETAETTTPPAQPDNTAAELNKVIEHICRRPAARRLHNRRAIRTLAGTISDIASFGYGISRARVLAGNLNGDPALAYAAVVVDALDSTLDHASRQAHALIRDLLFAKAFSFDSDLGSALDTARQINLQLRLALNSTGKGARTAHALARDLNYELAGLAARGRFRARVAATLKVPTRDLDLLQAPFLALTLALEPVQSDDLTKASDQLKRAADDFQGADLREAALTRVDLSWLRWDERTMWPGDWAERIQNASVEQPAGSGQYTVLPTFNNASAAIPASPDA